MIRVIQWATGQLGQIATRAMLSDARFQVAGAYVTTPSKHGVDVGTLVGKNAIGVKATCNIEDILALDADCVVYSPLRRNHEEVTKLLRSGKNVVSTVGYVYPKALGSDLYSMLKAACLEGGSSLHGTGIHPGFAGDLLPVVLAQISQGVDRIVVSEVADLSRHPSRKFLEGADFGRAISDVEAKPDETLERLTLNFRESLVMLADAMGFPADDFTARHMLAAATERATVACGDIEIGTVGGHLREWAVISGGVPKIVFKSCWRVVNGLEPELGAWPDGFVNIKYDIVVDGTPSLRCSFVPAAIKFDGTACDADPGSMARICTAMHAVNTIPQIVNSAPGIVTHLDLLGLRR